MKPSERIRQIINDIDATNTSPRSYRKEGWEQEVTLQAIIQYLDEEYEESIKHYQ